jgi:hypothetical protein
VPVAEDDAVIIATKAASEKFPSVKIDKDQAQPWPIENAWAIRFMPPEPKYLMITVVVRRSNGEVLAVYRNRTR